MFNHHHTPNITGESHAWWQFKSKFLIHPRDVIVWVPPGYNDDPYRRYPVLYVHDGQNLFDTTTSFMGVKWNLDNAAFHLIQDGVLEPFIMVGVYNSPDRIPDLRRRWRCRPCCSSRSCFAFLRPRIVAPGWFISHVLRVGGRG